METKHKSFIEQVRDNHSPFIHQFHIKFPNKWVCFITQYLTMVYPERELVWESHSYEFFKSAGDIKQIEQFIQQYHIWISSQLPKVDGGEQ